jgi:serine/threonine protein kinase
MAPPNITTGQVAQVIPQMSRIVELDKGGYKIVFSGNISGKKYAVKFLRPDPTGTGSADGSLIDEITARVRREVETIEQCKTPHLVKMGPIGLTTTEITGEPLIFYTEEFVEGSNLKQYYLEIRTFPVKELANLALHISTAIEELWSFAKIHRDIKPGNIMRRSTNGEFVLLDMGLVLDLQDASLSTAPMGTLLYISPEQADFDNRRAVMNFRSDLFSLGTVLYEMATGRHPFVTPDATTTWQIIGNIKNMDPVPPMEIRSDLPQPLNDIIIRLLAKRQALRYRSVSLFQKALKKIQLEGDES